LGCNKIREREKQRKTYLQRTARLTCAGKSDLVVVGSITANEAIIAVLESSMLDDSWVVSLQVVIVLVQTTRAMDTTNRADKWSWSPVGAGGVVDVLNLSGSVETTEAIESSIDAATA